MYSTNETALQSQKKKKRNTSIDFKEASTNGFFLPKPCVTLCNFFLSILRYTHVHLRTEMTYFPVPVLSNSRKTLFPYVCAKKKKKKLLGLGKTILLLAPGDICSLKSLNQPKWHTINTNVLSSSTCLNTFSSPRPSLQSC